ncbi:hypothetical protein [Paraburkholderia sp. 40]|uniref:hypothetical protein n=1 Tax=Paraburkholderia sp. 40 TaxID=2991059 RepID=UPI003D25BFB8
MPYGNAAAALAELGSLEGKVLVDVTNPLTDDYMGLTIGHTTSAAEEIAKLTGASVVKAFNTLFAQVLDGGAAFSLIPAFGKVALHELRWPQIKAWLEERECGNKSLGNLQSCLRSAHRGCGRGEPPDRERHVWQALLGRAYGARERQGIRSKPARAR